MKISKSDNQYYGRYVERGIVDCLNGTTIQNYENYDFPQEHLIEMNNDIQIISNYLPLRGVRASHSRFSR